MSRPDMYRAQWLPGIINYPETSSTLDCHKTYVENLTLYYLIALLSRMEYFHKSDAVNNAANNGRNVKWKRPQLSGNDSQGLIKYYVISLWLITSHMWHKPESDVLCLSVILWQFPVFNRTWIWQIYVHAETIPYESYGIVPAFT